MLSFGNKEFRNLQEQVLKNAQDIASLESGEGVLSEFGIRVVGQIETIAELPLPGSPEFISLEYGDAYAVGTQAPYLLYIKTRAGNTHTEDYWFNIGSFPAPGPQGQPGPAIEIQVIDGIIKYRTVGTEFWTNIIPLSQIRGERGLTGERGSSWIKTTTPLSGGYTTVPVSSLSQTPKLYDLVVSSSEYSIGAFGVVTATGTTTITVQYAGNIRGPQGTGTTVIGNPTGAATDTLTKIKIEDIIYEIDSGDEAVWGNITGDIADQEDLNYILLSKVDEDDLAEVATTGDYDDLINKPTIPTKTSDLTNDSDFITDSEVDTKLEDYATKDELDAVEDEIPDVSGLATKTELTTGLATKQNTISDLDEIRSGAEAGSTAVQPSALNSYATKTELTTHTGNTNIHVTTLDKDSWNNKVDPSDISDMATKTWTNAQGFLKSADIADKADVSYVDQEVGAVAADLDTLESTVDQLSTSLTTEVSTRTSEISRVSGLIDLKQDIISDLTTIRSGAALGATAVQPATLNSYATISALNTGLSAKQDIVEVVRL